MSYTDQTLNQLVINKLSKTKYQELANNDEINEDELYLVPDDSGYSAGTGINITNDTISVDNTVALKSELFSGSYNDLSNKPDLSVYQLAATAFDGDYDSLTNKPDLSVYVDKTSDQTITGTKTIGTALGETGHLQIPLGHNGTNNIQFGLTSGWARLYADSNYFTIKRKFDDYHYYELKFPAGSGSSFSTNHLFYMPLSINGKTADAAGSVEVAYNDLTNKPDLSIYAESANLATVATTGDYNDLTNKPTLFSGSYNDLTNKPDLSVYQLAANAFSGDYDDLTNKPSIPTMATSISTVTPTTTQLVFTYTDNTTETITLMTGASVSTTTTLS